ncbi:uncharacterized protein LOC122296618 [Carya illinoinensis]|uniref:uncharacterized protein LOC122296618 n=1 Tax=Carya illinoinensis TaxID=32201 RepID=UPI001C71DF97|nr:uncharacterized protein LOC122296618 [Carya illinoinensis]
MGINTRVTNEMNMSISRDFTRLEVEEAVKQMAPLKSPSPDGFGACFYQNHWSIIVDEVCKTALSVLNGSKINPTRGLRQGDPLSPYLFLICGESLSNILNSYEKQRLTRGVQVIRGGTSINHLLFADDCILFGRAKLEEWGRIQELLKKYERASGQFLNKEKTSVFFNSNTKAEDKRRILEAGDSVLCGSYEKYLGLPTIVGRSKYQTFSILKERWGKQQTEWGIQWRKWVKMGLQKGKGRLGFRDLESFNLALLVKQGWRLIRNPNSLTVVSPISSLQGDSRAKELIDNQKREWDEEKIRSIFSDDETEQILSIPLSKGKAQDKIIWGPSKKGLFTINSAYYLQLERLKNKKGGCSEEEKEDKRWRCIWELEVPRVNWNASLDLRKKRMEVGIMIRDEEGEALGAICDQRQHVQTPVVAEGYALWKALELCNDLNIQKAIFEGDAKAVILAVLSTREDLSFGGSLIEDIQSVLANRSDWSIQFAYREKNNVAHSLAKEALRLEEKKVWIEEVPVCIAACLSKDKLCIG